MADHCKALPARTDVCPASSADLASLGSAPPCCAPLQPLDFDRTLTLSDAALRSIACESAIPGARLAVSRRLMMRGQALPTSAPVEGLRLLTLLNLAAQQDFEIFEVLVSLDPAPLVRAQAVTLLRLGRLAELAEFVRTHVHEALERGDLFAATYARMHTWYAPIAAADVTHAGAEMREAIARWSTGGFHIMHFWALYAEAQYELYAGRASAAWSLLGRGSSGPSAGLPFTQPDSDLQDPERWSRHDHRRLDAAPDSTVSAA